MPSNHITTGAYSLEHKERYDIVIGEERCIHVLQHVIVPRDVLPCIYSLCTCNLHTCLKLLFEEKPERI